MCVPSLPNRVQQGLRGTTTASRAVFSYLAWLRRSARLIHYGVWGRSLLGLVLSAEAGHLPKIPSRDVKVPHGDFGWVAR